MGEQLPFDGRTPEPVKHVTGNYDAFDQRMFAEQEMRKKMKAKGSQFNDAVTMPDDPNDADYAPHPSSLNRLD